jgi:thiol:disulfide interchange protein DsbD
MRDYIYLFLILIGLTIPSWNFATQEISPIQVELLAEEETIQPGRPFWIALHLKIEEGWHTYWKNPGEAGLPLKLDWKLPPTLQAGPLKWPFPEKFIVEEMTGFGYHREVILLSQMIPASTLHQQEVDIQAHVEWLVCSSLNCQPGSTLIHLTLKVDPNPPKPNLKAIELFKQARSKLPASISVKTFHKEGIVQFQVPKLQSNTESIKEAQFFPEEPNVIDSSFEPLISVHSTDSRAKGYFVNLKGSEEMGAKDPKHLKGVLVVHTDHSVQAFDIDSPIHLEGEKGLISFVDLGDLKPHSHNGSSSSLGDLSNYSNPQSFEGGLLWALIFAFVGGMLLNLMPCVLPVMSFKIMSFVKMAGQSRLLTIKHGLMFSFGVLISFWILAGSMLILRTYGQTVGWGFQLQEPFFVVILASILFIFALSLFGLFEWGIGVASWAGQTQAETSQNKSRYSSSFFSGVLATAVATPCTGPFLGSAVGFAVTLPIFQSLSIFTSLALGMCSPYLLLSAFPSFLRFLPRPGPWMETFKECMGFVLLVTVLWLMWVFSAQTNTFSLICLMGGFLCFSIGAWLYGKGSSPLVRRSKRLFAYAFVICFVLVGFQIILWPRDSWYEDEQLTQVEKKGNQWNDWENFSPQRLAELRQQGVPVLIDFTAKWCLICQANHLVFSQENVKKQLDQTGVVRLKADWTKRDAVITQELSKFGRNSVPLYVLYGPDQAQEPVIMPQVLTSDIVLEHLNQAMHPKKQGI